MAETLQEAPGAIDPRLAALKRIAVVPAYNEAGSIGAVIDEIRAADPELEVVIVDDGSRDRTAEVARARGARVIELPFNLGIGGAVQTGYRYAHERGFDLALRVDGDGQHDPAQLGRVLEPVLRGDADIAVGSRFAADGAAGYRSSRSRRRPASHDACPTSQAHPRAFSRSHPCRRARSATPSSTTTSTGASRSSRRAE